MRGTISRQPGVAAEVAAGELVHALLLNFNRRQPSPRELLSASAAVGWGIRRAADHAEGATASR